MSITTDNDEWTCNGSINKVLQGYLLSGFLGIAGLLLLFVFDDHSSDASLIGYIQLAFSVLVALLAYRGGRNSKRLLIMNNDGMWYKGWGVPPVSWSQIATVEVAGSRINAYLRMTLHDPAAPRATLKIPGADIAAPLDVVNQAAQDYLSRAN